jgi:signal transduction histidine kinase
VTSDVKQEIADRSRALALFRILQEALTNVIRHANAGAVRIILRQRGRAVTLVVKDNGRGITKAEMSNVDSIGLLGMTERARLIGGRLSIAGVPGRGTTVTVQVPIA